MSKDEIVALAKLSVESIRELQEALKQQNAKQTEAVKDNLSERIKAYEEKYGSECDCGCEGERTIGERVAVLEDDVECIASWLLEYNKARRFNDNEKIIADLTQRVETLERALTSLNKTTHDMVFTRLEAIEKSIRLIDKVLTKVLK